MRRFFAEIDGKRVKISGDENNHLRNVLRLSVGESVVAFNGDGKDYHAKILSVGKAESIAEVEKVELCPGLPKHDLVLCAAAVKREKLELIIQKSAELGCKKLVFFESEFSTMKLKDEKLSRYEKIILSASKQCERADLMSLKFLSFEAAVNEFSKASVRLFANEREGEEFDFSKLKSAQSIAILVGCEGGFSPKEKQKILSVKPENISLGNRILRAETAAIVLAGIASTLSGN